MDMSIPLFAPPLAMGVKIDSGPSRRSRAFRRVGIALLVVIILAIVIAVAVHETSAHHRSTSNGPAADPSSSSPNASHTLSDDMAIVRSRRISDIIGSAPGVENAPAWLATLGSDGKWPDSEVNYTTGCGAQRANWPAWEHWVRIVALSAAYQSGAPDATGLGNNSHVQQEISRAMDWWFERDFTNSDCLYNGGSGNCPCSAPGLWNTNWFSSVILVPLLVAQSCLAMNNTLSATQASNCSHMTTRAYSPLYLTANVPGWVSGANILDIARVGIDQGVRVQNATLVSDAYRRIHEQMVISSGIKVDGIKPDGSFGQHNGLMYNGNYGTVFSNDVVALETAAAGTSFGASDTAKSVFGTLFDGDKWMIYYNTVTNVLHWDYSALSRFIAFPVADGMADANIMMNVTQVGALGQAWNSSSLSEYASSLSSSPSSANAGNLVGNRLFWSNDYMVHRGSNYVTTLKMYSSRTNNTEDINSQNPFGFHLADGALYTYVDGSEYEDIAAAWDWNKIPGITTDYGATPLVTKTEAQTGLGSFVGGASTGAIGVGVMRYANPLATAFGFSKAWFFLPGDVQHVMIAGVASSPASPIISVLDQKRHRGSVLLGASATGALSAASTNATAPVGALWHANVGYTVDPPAPVAFATGARTGAWSAIGTSDAAPETIDLFSAWLVHRNFSAPAAYTAFPGLSADAFDAKRRTVAENLHTVNDAHAMAVWDDEHETGMAVFWDSAGGSVQLPDGTTLAADSHAAVIYEPAAGKLTVSDPSQSLAALGITITLSGQTKTYQFALPPGPGGMAGSSVTQTL